MQFRDKIIFLDTYSLLDCLYFQRLHKFFFSILMAMKSLNTLNSNIISIVKIFLLTLK